MRQLSPVAVRGPLLLVEHRQGLRPLAEAAAVVVFLQSTGPRHLGSGVAAQAQLLHGPWDIPRPGIKPVSLGLVDSQPLDHQESSKSLMLNQIKL